MCCNERAGTGPATPWGIVATGHATMAIGPVEVIAWNGDVSPGGVRVMTSDHRARSLLAVAVLLAASACEVPAYPGAQLQAPPSGFRVDNDAYHPRRMLFDREVIDHSAWIGPSPTAFSGIYINGHVGVVTLEDVAAAQEDARAFSDEGTTFGEIERITIDGRPAWGWFETRRAPELGSEWVAYRTVVAYDTVSYAIEFHSSDPVVRAAAPDTLRAIVASFAIAHTELNWRLIVGTLFLVVAAMHFLHLALRDTSSPREFELAQVPGHERLRETEATRRRRGSPILPGGAPAPHDADAGRST